MNVELCLVHWVSLEQYYALEIINIVTAGPGRLVAVPYAHMRAVKIRAQKWESDTQVLLMRFSTLLHANFVP